MPSHLARIMRTLFVAATVTHRVAVVHAQEPSHHTVSTSRPVGSAGKRPLLPRAEEIALARSAAPAAVSGSATIWVLTETGFERAVEGTNGATCFVSRDWVVSLEPVCGDAEAERTVFPMWRARTERLHAGDDPAVVHAWVQAGIADGRFPLPARPAAAYMMSAKQQLFTDTGRAVGAWRPHVMVFVPYATLSTFALGPSGTATLQMQEEGRAFSNLVVVVPDWVQVEAPR